MKRLLSIMFAVTLVFTVLGCGAENSPKSPTKSTSTQTQSALIDINRANAEELMTLKGIGEARSKAIIKGRPYTRKDELVQREIVPQSVYNGIKDQIIAKQK